MTEKSIFSIIWHFVLEQWWAFVFAIIFGIYAESRRGKSLVKKVLALCSEVNKKRVSDCNLLKPEIDEAIKSNCNNVTKEIVARQISTHDALTWNKKYIYTDTEKKYYFTRSLSDLKQNSGG